MTFSVAARYGELKEFIVWKSNIINLEETGTRVATRQARKQTDKLENKQTR
jgi:hypothetical protein